MTGRTSSRSYRVLGFLSVFACLAMMLVGCSAGGGGSSASGPITIGVSLSLSGDFSADGKAFQQGYNLWASDVNKNGGLLGRRWW